MVKKDIFAKPKKKKKSSIKSKKAKNQGISGKFIGIFIISWIGIGVLLISMGIQGSVLLMGLMTILSWFIAKEFTKK